jgi:hypothetical protein
MSYTDSVFNRDKLVPKVETMEQVCGIKEYSFENGTADGVRAADFYNGSGLSFTVLKSRGMDIGDASYNGIPLFWRSFAGLTTPSEAFNSGLDFGRCFYGGLLMTCGVTYTGRPCVDGDEELGLHGRYSNQRAKITGSRTEWEGDDYILEMSGETKEASIFGPNVKVERKIRTRLGEPSLEVEDSFINCGNMPSPHSTLYHWTFGYPLVDEGAELIYSAKEVIRLDDAVRDNAEVDIKKIAAPSSIHNGRAQDFFYIDVNEDSSGMARVGLVNKRLGLGVKLEYPKAQLPRLGNWLKFGEGGAYAIAFEPMNSGVESRITDRERGWYVEVDPGDRRDYRLKLTVLRSLAEIEEFEASLK